MLGGGSGKRDWLGLMISRRREGEEIGRGEEGISMGMKRENLVVRYIGLVRSENRQDSVTEMRKG